MPTQAITSDFLASLAQIRPTSGLVSYFDTELRGFLLELRASGRASWYFRYRDAQRKIRLCRIGTFPEVSLADARAKAYEMRTLLRRGAIQKQSACALASSLLLPSLPISIICLLPRCASAVGRLMKTCCAII